MGGWKAIAIWIGCVLVGATIGLLLGWLLWKAGLELIGSAVMLVGAAVGGILVLFAYMRWQENRGM